MGASTVEITLTADADTTVVRVRHSGLPSDAARNFHGFGWNVTINRLLIVAEGGDPGPNPWEDE